MAADGGFTACRIRWRYFGLALVVFGNLSGDLQSGSGCPPYIISHFILFPFSKTAPPPSPSLISPFSQDVGRSASTFPSASFASWLCTAAQVFSGSQVANWFPSVGR